MLCLLCKKTKERQEKDMKKFFTKLLRSNGGKLCALAVTLASVAPYCCRGSWYQPKEPKGLEDFLKAGSCKSIGNSGCVQHKN